jgi:hypothetical protein
MEKGSPAIHFSIRNFQFSIRVPMKRLLLWCSGLALLTGAIIQWVRPARLTSARVTAITPGDPPSASVALTYSVGAMPAHVIVDVADEARNGGSATVDGDQMFIDIPLIGAPLGSYRVTATATYLVLGRPLTVVREFTSG